MMFTDPVARMDQMRAGFADIAAACVTFKRQLQDAGFNESDAQTLVEIWLTATLMFFERDSE